MKYFFFFFSPLFSIVIYYSYTRQILLFYIIDSFFERGDRYIDFRCMEKCETKWRRFNKRIWKKFFWDTVRRVILFYQYNYVRKFKIFRGIFKGNEINMRASNNFIHPRGWNLCVNRPNISGCNWRMLHLILEPRLVQWRKIFYLVAQIFIARKYFERICQRCAKVH